MGGAPVPAAGLTLGLMSGTSLDGVDGALVRWSGDTPTTLGFGSASFSATERAELLALQAPGENELHRAAMARILIARRYADVAKALLADAPAGERVIAIGAHGQTIRHRPDLGYTVQLIDGALLAELTGVPVVCDFRSADVAAGGQGAPLVPAFHQAVFASPGERRAVVNLGGIANVSLLAPGETALGHDTGPANVLLDLWAERHTGEPIDRDGRLAAAGTVQADLLERMLGEPYFGVPPPKSTGRDLFHGAWLDGHLEAWGKARGRRAPWPVADVQATLLELTATTVARACRAFGADAIYLCGGGAHNPVLLDRIARASVPVPVRSTQALGAPPQAVEAVAFAWLAMRRCRGEPGNLPAVTGAAGPRVLGAVYPAPG